MPVTLSAPIAGIAAAERDVRRRRRPTRPRTQAVMSAPRPTALSLAAFPTGGERVEGGRERPRHRPRRRARVATAHAGRSGQRRPATYTSFGAAAPSVPEHDLRVGLLVAQGSPPRRGSTERQGRPAARAPTAPIAGAPLVARTSWPRRWRARPGRCWSNRASWCRWLSPARTRPGPRSPSASASISVRITRGWPTSACVAVEVARRTSITTATSARSGFRGRQGNIDRPHRQRRRRRKAIKRVCTSRNSMLDYYAPGHPRRWPDPTEGRCGP